RAVPSRGGIRAEHLVHPAEGVRLGVLGSVLPRPQGDQGQGGRHHGGGDSLRARRAAAPAQGLHVSGPMIRIFSLFHPERPVNAYRLSQVKRIFADNFAGEGTERTIVRILRKQREHGYRVVLIVAEGPRVDVKGFALAYRFPKVPFAYLDFIVTSPRVR